MKKTFILCGFTGLCMEVLWTGLHSIIAGEFTMTGKTSLLMFPVYGCAAVISLKNLPPFLCASGAVFTRWGFLLWNLSAVLFSACFISAPGITAEPRSTIKV